MSPKAVLFVGPSYPPYALEEDFGADILAALDVRGPARAGDVYRAVQDGAQMIGIVDGYFEVVPSIWHKEILFALKIGVHMLGASSMGALRAAEQELLGFKRPDGSASPEDFVGMNHAKQFDLIVHQCAIAYELRNSLNLDEILDVIEKLGHTELYTEYVKRVERGSEQG